MWLESVARDIGLTFREWLRLPGLPAAAITTLALGIGANTAVVSAFYAVALRPLPFASSDSVVYLAGSGAAPPGVMTLRLPLGDVAQLRTQSTTLSSISVLVVDEAPVRLPQGDDVVSLKRAFISPSAFDLLDVRPALGRLFTPDDEGIGAEPVTILSYAAWQEHFAGDPTLVGRTIRTRSDVQTVVGIMPRGFAFPTPDVEMWSVARLPSSPVIAVSANPASGDRNASRSDPRRTGREPSANDGVASTTTQIMAPTIARINPGMSVDAATAELNLLFLGMHPEAVRAMAAGAPAPLKLIPVREFMAAPVHRALLMLASAAAVVLCIACSNVSWLVMARGIARRHDISVRIALGASRSRVIRERLTESLLLALVGGVAGAGLAALGLQVLHVVYGGTIPRLAEVQIDGSFLLSALVSALISGLLSGALPALQISRFRPGPLMRHGSAIVGTTTHALGRWWASVLTTAQVSASVVLLVATGLLLRSVDRLARLDVGYEPDRVLSCDVRIPPTRTAPGEPARFIGALLERLRTIPETESVAATMRLPTERGGTFSGLLTVPGSAAGVPIRVTVVTTGYRDALRLRLAEGRWFDDRDRPGGPVALVLSRKAAAGVTDGGMIDRVVTLNGPLEGVPLTVVGTVDDTLTGGIESVPQPEAYVVLDQWPAGAQPQEMLRSFAIVLRSDGDPARLASAVRGVVSQADTALFAEHIESLQQRVARLAQRPVAYSELLGTFTVMAVAIAVVGLYGLVAYLVNGQRHEMGVRIALGARRLQIVGAVLGRCVSVTLVGIGVGLMGAALTSRYLESLLFGVTPLDAMTFGAVTLSIIVIAAMAAFGPMRRAMRTDPCVVLRAE